MEISEMVETIVQLEADLHEINEQENALRAQKIVVATRLGNVRESLDVSRRVGRPVQVVGVEGIPSDEAFGVPG